ncbi:MAG: HAD hydrolase family protein [Candidatus Eisenbacteria bacterium]|nr:HAD hydrolase family protein [Candidatus Eisenbacteria bacterium]
MVAAEGPISAVIPARGGSKGIPRKNIRSLAGYPLIAYSIAAARLSARVERVIVSTDDEEIAAVASQWGAEVPFLRPAELAQDETPDLPVFAHVLDWLAENEEIAPSLLVQLRPTSPLRPPDCVDAAIGEIERDAEADSVRGVTPAGQTPYKMWRIAAGYLSPLLASEHPEPYNMPRQKLPVVHWQTGHIEVIRPRTIRERQSLTGERIRPLVIDGRYAIDLDTPPQWELAEQILLRGDLPRVDPAALLPCTLGHIRLLVTDFDGVFTDDSVRVDQDGRESVVCSRADGLGLEMLRRAGLPVVVLSKERNPVVAARCRKLELPCVQAVDDKGPALVRLAQEHGCGLREVAFVGNDLNDLPAMQVAGLGIAVGDAHREVRARADFVLSRPGGRGAVRELCERILAERRAPRVLNGGFEQEDGGDHVTSCANR